MASITKVTKTFIRNIIDGKSFSKRSWGENASLQSTPLLTLILYVSKIPVFEEILHQGLLFNCCFNWIDPPKVTEKFQNVNCGQRTSWELPSTILSSSGHNKIIIITTGATEPWPLRCSSATPLDSLRHTSNPGCILYHTSSPTKPRRFHSVYAD